MLHSFNRAGPLLRSAEIAAWPVVVPSGCRGRGGMTLIEILIVVVLLGILAMVVIPKYAGASDAARVAAAREILKPVQAKIIQYHSTHGDWPATIDADWFTGGELPDSPFDPDHPIGIKYNPPGNEAKIHPVQKSIVDTGSFWYNPTNGCFRARVTARASKAKTLELYNLVNSCALTAFTQTAIAETLP